MEKKPESDKTQYVRFLAKVKELEDAGELSPTADDAMNRVVGNVKLANQRKNPEEDLQGHRKTDAS